MNTAINETLAASINARIVDKHNIAYILTDENLIIEAHNSIVRQWLDEKQPSLIGLPLTAVFEGLSHHTEKLSQLAKNEHQGLPPPKLQQQISAGKAKHLQLEAEPFEADGPKLLLSLADVTAQTNRELLYHTVIEDQTEFICRYLPNGRLTFINGAYCRYLNRPPTDLLGQRWLWLVAEADQANVSSAILLLNAENPSITLEHRVVLPTNETRWQRWVHRVILSEQGQVIEYMGVGRDITNQKQLEQALHRVRFSIDWVVDSIFWIDASGRFMDANETATWKLGYEREELHSMHFGDIDPKFKDQGWLDLWTEIQQRRVVGFESTFYTRDSRPLPVEVVVHNLELDNTAYICIFVRDITERKEANQALLETESRLESIITNSPIILWSTDKDGIFTLSEGQGLELLGLRPGQVVGQSVFELYQDYPEVQHYLRKALAGQIANFTVKISHYIFEVQVSHLYNEANEILGLIGISTDITEREQTRQFLAKREAYLTALVELQRRLLLVDAIETMYEDAIRLFGPVSEANRVCLFERDDNQAFSFALGAIWQRDKTELQTNALFEQDVQLIQAMPNWIDKLDQGEAIFETTENLPASGRQLLLNSGILSILLVPLRVNGQLFGLITFENTTELHSWDMSETSLLQAAAAAISLAKEQQLTKKALAETNQQLEQRVKERTADLVQLNETLQTEITERKRAEALLQNAHDELEVRIAARTSELTSLNNKLETLYQVGKEITNQHQLDQLLNSLAHRTTKLLNADSSCILLLDETGKYLTIKVSYGLTENLVRNTFDQVGQSIAGRVVQLRRPIIANDIPNDSRFENSAANLDNLLAIISVPLIVGQNIIGTLDAHSQTHRNAFDEQDLKLLKMLAGQAAIAIENARLYTQLNSAIEELKTVNDNLQRAKEQAEAANQAKSAFLANMSHELRTPLNGVLGFTQILKQDTNMTRDQAEAIDIIHSSGEHLLVMINDILDLSKIEAGKLELEPRQFYLPHFIKGVVEMLRIGAEQKGLQLNVEMDRDLPTGVFADEKRLRQILINLLGNAIKFTAKGQVILRVSVYQPVQVDTQTGVFLFEVEDTGMGIATDKLEEIFAPFHQIKDKRISSNGTGLGLAISRRLVRMMNSDLQVESNLGQGTRFWFEISLPLTNTVDMPQPLDSQKIVGYQSSQPEASPSLTILVVDDKLEDRQVLRQFLTPAGFNIIEAANGQEAVEQAQTHHPDLIIMDIIMPVMNGFEATRCIRQTNTLQNTPIIATSVGTFSRTNQRSQAVGCQDYINKPIVAHELFQKIKSYLGVDWLYQTQKQSAQSENSIQETDFTIPDRNTLEAIRDLALIGDIEGIQTHTQKIIDTDSQFIPFASKINKLADHFALDEIETLINMHLNSHQKESS